jgi:hypothetical protein
MLDRNEHWWSPWADWSPHVSGAAGSG